MKQFIVDRHTTPNTPTLEQVPTEKIPVYEDMDAAATDLANLAENQIIATHDTGSELSAPVDTVQSGNMHAVTSNAVANKCCRFPDYAHPIDLGTAQSWTATEDCYAEWFYMTSATNREFFINNNKVNVQDYFQLSGSTIYIFVFNGYVKKGDVISSSQPWSATILKAFPLI